VHPARRRSDRGQVRRRQLLRHARPRPGAPAAPPGRDASCRCARAPSTRPPSRPASRETTDQWHNDYKIRQDPGRGRGTMHQVTHVSGIPRPLPGPAQDHPGTQPRRGSDQFHPLRRLAHRNTARPNHTPTTTLHPSAWIRINQQGLIWITCGSWSTPFAYRCADRPMPPARGASKSSSPPPRVCFRPPEPPSRACARPA